MMRLTLAAALPTAVAALPQLQQHNVIMVLTDDQDIVLGSMDPKGPMQKTRALVVEKGAYFTNGFATTPICCPSRAEITSGRYMHNTHVYGNDCGGMDWVNGPEKLNMATYLSNAGYTTFYAGKYLNNYGSPKVGGCAHVPPGWDQWYGLVGNSKYYGYTVCTGNNGSEVHGNDYATDYFTDRIANRTLEFLANVTAHKAPFFAMTGTPASHGPNDPAPQYSETYAGMKAPRLPSWNIAPNPDKHYLLRHILPMDEQHANVSDIFFQRRWSVLRSVDDMVERFITFLTRAGVMDDTYLIFSSDHGYHLGEFGMLYDKRMLYETDIRVPLFVSGPGIKAGQTIESPVGHIDLAPTILSMAGIETPPQMDGRSWLPLVFGGMDDGEPNVASASQVDAAAGWRHTFMVEYSGGGAPELADPDAVQAEVTFEDKHWFHSMSFQNDASAALLSSVEGAGPVYPAYYNSSCGGSASDELSIWGKCSCTATFGHSTLVHDQSPCDSANNTYACIRTLVLGSDVLRSSMAGERSEADVVARSSKLSLYAENTIYCEFDDAENFKEFYDLNVDPYNLKNIYADQSPAKKEALAKELAMHKACKGAGCFMPK